MVLHLVLWWFFPLLVFAFYMHPPCMRVALACSTIPWSYTFHVSIDYDGGRKLRERERGGSGSEGQGRRVKKGWKEGRRRWKETEPGEEKAKRMQTHISWKDSTVRYLATGPLFFGSSGNLLQCKLFFYISLRLPFLFRSKGQGRVSRSRSRSKSKSRRMEQELQTLVLPCPKLPKVRTPRCTVPPCVGRWHEVGALQVAGPEFIFHVDGMGCINNLTRPLSLCMCLCLCLCPSLSDSALSLAQLSLALSLSLRWRMRRACEQGAGYYILYILYM